MIYHFCGTSVYANKFIHFLIRNKTQLNLEEHFFVIYDYDHAKWSEELYQNIQHKKISTEWGFIPILRKLGNNDKVIIHGFTLPKLAFYLYLRKKHLKKIIWSVWGGDAYFNLYLSESWSYRYIEFIRKSIIPKIPVITCVVKGDYDYILKTYNSKAVYLQSIYSSDINDETSKKLFESDNITQNRILIIGNSADPSNNHIEVIQALAKYNNEIEKVLVPLMYGGTQNYISEVVSQGTNILGSKFVPLLDFLPSSEYVKILNSASVQILNHNRQQGLGNVFLMLAMKKRIFLRGDISSYEYFNNLGIKVNDTRDLFTGKAEIFNFEPNILQKNKDIMLKEISENHLLELWSKVFALKL